VGARAVFRSWSTWLFAWTCDLSRQFPDNRDRGEPRGSSPPTPPCIRVRTRRFVRLSAAGLRQPRRTLDDVSRRADFDPFDQRRSGLHPFPPF
jgi:hypothetical protein